MVHNHSSVPNRLAANREIAVWRCLPGHSMSSIVAQANPQPFAATHARYGQMIGRHA